VASNLLRNALTHGSPVSPVTITARTDEHDLVLEVWNGGVPIPPESIGKIFEPFWRNSVSGQHASYLLKQLLVIQSVLRTAPVMHGVIKDLTRDHMQAVVAHLESV
jgi:K+-sensing histidine kinase KdpD